MEHRVVLTFSSLPVAVNTHNVVITKPTTIIDMFRAIIVVFFSLDRISKIVCCGCDAIDAWCHCSIYISRIFLSFLSLFLSDRKREREGNKGFSLSLLYGEIIFLRMIDVFQRKSDEPEKEVSKSIR